MNPLSTEQMLAAFGDPRPFLRPDGTIAPDWERKIIGTCSLPARLPLSWDHTHYAIRFKCHRLLVGAFDAAMAELHDDIEVWRTINDFGGCYEFRARRMIADGSRGIDRLSKHAWGAAIDWDVCDNPQGADPKVHPRLPLIMASHGFLWGGSFAHPYTDGMHFEFADLSKLPVPAAAA